MRVWIQTATCQARGVLYCIESRGGWKWEAREEVDGAVWSEVGEGGTGAGGRQARVDVLPGRRRRGGD